MGRELHPDNDRIRKYLNVDKYHAIGITGKGVIIGSAEEIMINGSTTDNSREHDYLTTQAILEIAPDVDLVHTKFYVTDTQIGKTIDDISDSGAIGYYRSLAKYDNDYHIDSKYDKEFARIPNVCVFNSAGNESSNKYASLIAENGIFGVGAYILRDDTPYMAYYSSTSQYVDFVAPTYLTVDNQGFGGTSCSAPVMTGMYALFQQFFKEKTGSYLSREMAYKFILDNCKDIKDKGRDDLSGYGVFILPDPEDIVLEDYATASGLLDRFQDTDKISAWALPSVEKMVKNAIVNGKGDNIAPQDTLTREEMMVMLDRYNNIVEKKLNQKILD